MAVPDFHYGNDDPELILRPFLEPDARIWFGPERQPPPLVLEMFVGDEMPERWAFGLDPTAVGKFHRDTIATLGAKKFKQKRFESLSEVDRVDALTSLAEASRKILTEALGDEEFERFSLRLDALPEASVLRVADEGLGGPGLPWGLLHPGTIDGARPEAGLLGHRFVLTAAVQSRSGPARPGLDLFGQPNAHRYGFVDFPGLRTVRQGRERISLSLRAGADFDPLHEIPHDYTECEEDVDAYPDISLASLDELADYLVFTSRTGMHFACDSWLTSSPSPRYMFAVRHKTHVDVGKLRQAVRTRADRVLSREPRISASFVFLNMCVSATGAPGNDASSALGSMGARAMIGTIGDVCELSAASLADEFYGGALGNGQSVGIAFLNAVRSAMATSRNPTNLLFVLKGDPHLVLR